MVIPSPVIRLLVAFLFGLPILTAVVAVAVDSILLWVMAFLFGLPILTACIVTVIKAARGELNSNEGN